MSVYQNIIGKNGKIAIIGLGYVGLPLAVEFGKKIPVIGFDTDNQKVDILKQGLDPNNELEYAELSRSNITYSSNEDILDDAIFFVIAVPTPIDNYKHPDLTLLKSATRIVAKYLKKGDYVVYESTVYPGATEEDCVPILEDISGLKFKQDFKVGYSPERINPGDKIHTLTNTVKIVSGCDDESVKEIEKIYKLVIEAKIHVSPSIKTAEAAKIIENTQRDVNIGLMNELSIIFGRMNINIYDVLEAAGTKWNFLKFYPGLVGGHCIGVDPYYLAHKAKEYNYHPQIINAGRFVNDTMGRYVGKLVVKKMLDNKIKLPGARIIIFGVTFKENVSDIRNSKVFDIVSELTDYGVKVELTDPFANAAEIKEKYNVDLNSNPIDNPRSYKFDAAIVAVSHNSYLDYNEKDFISILTKNAIFADVKGMFRNKISSLGYWSL